jgi:hypothetical protein
MSAIFSAKARFAGLAGHRADDAHRQGGRLPCPAFERRGVAVVERQRRGWRRRDRDRQAFGGDRVVADPGRAGAGERGERLRREAEDRERAGEELGGDERAEGHHVLGLGEDQRRRGAAGEGELEEHAGAGAGAARRRQHQDAAGDRGAVQRVVHVDDPGGRGIDAAPEAERLAGGDDGAGRGAREDPAGQGRFRGHLTTKPWANGSRSSMKIVL